MDMCMKRIILSVMVMAFAVAVQAGDCPNCQNKDKAANSGGKVKTSLDAKASQVKDADATGCCGSKVKTSLETKGTCPFAMGTCSKQKAAKQVALLSPKAADLIR